LNGPDQRFENHVRRSFPSPYISQTHSRDSCSERTCTRFFGIRHPAAVNVFKSSHRRKPAEVPRCNSRKQVFVHGKTLVVQGKDREKPKAT
jgi:hypothetical protein